MTTLLVLFVFTLLLGVFSLSYHMYRLVVLDATCRGLKHPNFWGIFTLGSQSGNLILYLVGRNKYPSNMDEANLLVFNSLKRRIGLSLCCIAIGTIGAMAIALFGNIQ